MNRKIVVRIILILLALMIVFASIYYVFADEIDDSQFNAASIILIEAESGEVLYEKNADEIRAPASTTKLITALVVLDRLSLDEVITIPAEAQATGSRMGLQPGQQVSVETLLYGLMLSSGNDAAVALAIAVSGNVETFADLMNEKAEELGMLRSHFVTSSGLDDENHYVTARDMTYVAREVYKNQILRRIMATPSIVKYTEDKTVSFEMENTNMLIHTPTRTMEGKPYEGPEYLYESANGIKTGSTLKAKGCLIASAEREGLSFIAVILGDKSTNEQERWTDAAVLFDYAFSKYKRILLTELIGEDLYAEVENAPVVDGTPIKLRCLPVTKDGSYYMMIKREINDSSITYETNYNYTRLIAPLDDGVDVGTIVIKSNGGTILFGRLISAEAMESDEHYKNASEKNVIEPDVDDEVTKNTSILKRMMLPLITIAVIVLAVILILVIIGRRKKYVRLHGEDRYAKNLSTEGRRLRRYNIETSESSPEQNRRDTETRSVGRRVNRK